LNYYVYYKIDAARAAALKPLVEQMFSSIQKQTGVRGRWMRRRDDPSTYMEVYEDVRDEAAFEAVLKQESAGLGLQRKTELFQSA
jgi:quinol monooxygenase YgiN